MTEIDTVIVYSRGFAALAAFYSAAFSLGDAEAFGPDGKLPGPSRRRDG